MDKKWTISQRSAIEESGRDLLISAGAGSGKTAVLTARIIRRLMDDEHPAELSRMLIVTFTKAAAGELKERISAAITGAMAKNPGNRRLARQLLALDRAKICTIHSFCLDLLRETGDARVPAGFRIADETERKLLRMGLMNELLEEYFADGAADHKIENFPAFADTFVGTKGDDALAEIFLGIEEELSGVPEYLDFIAHFADELIAGADAGQDFGTTRCGAQILELVRGRITERREYFREMCEYFASDAKMAKAYLPAFSADVAFMDAVADAPDFESMRAAFDGFASPRLGSIRGVETPPDIERAKDLRKKFHEARVEMAEKFFSLSADAIRKNARDTAAALQNLHTLLSAFVYRFTEEKRRRALLDFNDLERLAYDMLISGGNPTPAAADIAARFDEIYIDEYQDVNAVQDAIFAAVSSGRNRFMVGDIKQSIYGFRGAEPGIFADYRRKFGKLSDPDLPSDSGAAIFLSDNFRCDTPIIDFTNIVSACLFTGGRGDISFTPEDLLVHSKPDAESGEPVHVILLSGEDSEEEDVSEPEAEYAASEAARLIREGKKDDGSPIRPGDIAILMRSAKSQSAAFEAAFARHGIPLHNSVSGDFFENAEVLLALSILSVIDNPTRDIYLAATLRSPVFGFTLDELLMIRRAHPDGCLYDALRAFSAAEEFPKGRAFLDTLAKWREKAIGMPVDRLLWYIYTDTDLGALVCGDGMNRRPNLMLLYEYARRFEASSFKGLYNFIRYVNDILENKATLETARISGDERDTVKLMTIHQSKGLEFPVCFLCGTGRKFNEGDLRKNIVIERSLGIAPKLADTTGFARYDTSIRQAIVKRLSDSQLEEEMRVLYVAMTRARERLYVTALVKDPAALLDETAEDAKGLSKYTILKNGGYMRWILLALAHHGGTLPCTIETVRDIAAPEVHPMTAIPEAEAADDALSTLAAEHFDFVYPRAHAAKLPAKLSVSRLYPTVLDEDEAPAAELSSDGESGILTKRPRFLDAAADERATGAERGTATHLFMQFCDFSRFRHASGSLEALVREEAARLAAAHFVTPRTASLADVRRLAGFFAGETFREICASPRVFREHRFNVKLPAGDFTADEEMRRELRGETILVQGVIDCFYENPDGSLTILDYKTDFIPPELTFDEARAMLIDRHGLQLGYYKAALERIAAKPVSRVEIWSFGLNRKISL
ncbi:MAG: hypothetical protein E7632_08920 [Ruminococcaceae bacterium]|nr:hypothetical protein [Oscillospiraceae bacterium]